MWSQLTSLVVDGEHGDLSASSPSSQFGRLVNEAIQIRLGSLIQLGSQDGTQVIRLPRQARNISSNILGCAVVIVQDRRYLVPHGIPRLSDPNVQGENAGHDGKDEDVELGLEEAAHSESGLALLGSLDGGLVDGREGFLGEVSGFG